MVTTVKVPDGRLKEYFDKFLSESVLTYVGLDIHSPEAKAHFSEFEEILKKFGYSNNEVILYYVTGATMNSFFEYTGDNAYQPDTLIVFLPGMKDITFKLATRGRWFDDVIASNLIKQNAVDCNCAPDFR
jgi:hypothetical protein